MVREEEVFVTTDRIDQSVLAKLAVAIELVLFLALKFRSTMHFKYAILCRDAFNSCFSNVFVVEEFQLDAISFQFVCHFFRDLGNGRVVVRLIYFLFLATVVVKRFSIRALAFSIPSSRRSIGLLF